MHKNITYFFIANPNPNLTGPSMPQYGNYPYFSYQLSSFTGKTQVRYSHTDVSVPDFGDYRRPASQDSNKPVSNDISRRAFTYMMVAGMGITGMHASKKVLQDFLATMSASADVLAMAKIEIDLSTIPEGIATLMKD